MLLNEITVGRKVRLARDVEVFPTGIFPAGSTGVVVGVRGYGQQVVGVPVAEVRLDEHFDELDEWENELQVFLENDCSDAAPSAFELMAAS